MLAFSRLELLLGAEAVQRLSHARVAVFGLGGVGSWAAEAMARSGVGLMELTDADTVDETNLNRQLCALVSTVGRPKAEVLTERFSDINPQMTVIPRTLRYCEDTASLFDLSRFDCVLDCIDSVRDKALLIERASASGTYIISAMGAGGRTDPSSFRAGDIYQTSGCPLARVMRRELRKRGVAALRCVWSEQPPVPATAGAPVGSAAFAVPAAGLLMASEAVKHIIGQNSI